MSQPVYGRILNYRIGIRTQYSRECLIHFNGVDSAAQAGRLLGQRVVWKGEKRKLVGKVIGFHGKNGTVRVKFRKGVPGQALGTTVELTR
jgi:large subunit ribosomal protein L35Ae